MLFITEFINGKHNLYMHIYYSCIEAELSVVGFDYMALIYL